MIISEKTNIMCRIGFNVIAKVSIVLISLIMMWLIKGKETTPLTDASSALIAPVIVY